MQIKLVNEKDKHKWDNILKQNQACFVQSWTWGEIQSSYGRKIWRLGLYEHNNLKEVCLLIQYNLPFGFNWLYSPNWLIPKHFSQAKMFLDYIYNIAKDQKSIFFYTDPWLEDNESNKEFLNSLGLKNRKNHSIQPLDTFIIDIDKTDEDLLKNMHKKTRYNIKLAQKKNIEIVWSKEVKYIKDFYNLTLKTSQRQRIKCLDFEYYKKIILSPDFYLLSAVYKEKVIASLVLNIFGKNAVYVFGASDYDYRSLMAPYLLQWEAIKFSRQQGCKTYDFWGVQGKGKNTKKWAGITRFKKGFNIYVEPKHYVGLYIKIFRQCFFYLYLIFRKVYSLFR